MKKYLIVRADINRTFLNLLNEDYPIYEMYRFLIEKKTFPLEFQVLGKWTKYVSFVDTIILFDVMYYSKVSTFIKKKNPNCRIILYFWNVIDKKRKEILLDKNIDEFWTFDFQDSKKYHINYNPQFYSNKLKIMNCSCLYDIFFIGRDKGRKNDLLKLEKEFHELGFTTFFSFLENENDFIPYLDYLKQMSFCSVILDYNQKNQVGLSLRCMEALFFEKKLITNNVDIMNYDFYHPNNIFVLGVDDN